jgi:hypothetical protein
MFLAQQVLFILKAFSGRGMRIMKLNCRQESMVWSGFEPSTGVDLSTARVCLW